MIGVRTIRKLAAMDRREMASRGTGLLRREVEHLAYSIRRPSWHRASLVRALRDDLPELEPVRQALLNQAWMGAHESLMAYIVARPSRFVLHPSARPELASAILDEFPGAASAASRRADAVLNGRFDLLGYRGLDFSASDESSDGRIDWHCDPVHRLRAPIRFWSRTPYLDASCGDHKIIWELNRHQYWLSLGRAFWLSGNARYRNAFVEQLESWMAANPPLAGINWASMLELALRAISWVWALHFFSIRSDGEDRLPWTVDLFLGLDRQMRLVERNLSRYFSPNTHLLGEALGLYVVGRVFPEFRRAGSWERLGRDVLVDQASRQIASDGGHRELSTHYHRYTLDFYLLALAVARSTNDPAARPFADAARVLAHYARTMADDAGRLPNFGDDDGGALVPLCGRNPADASDSLQWAAHLLDESDLAVGDAAEEAAWLTGRPRAVPARRRVWPSRALPESGYFVSRSPRGDSLIVDAGPHGFLNGGHAHADALSLTLTVARRPFLIDPGTGCYTIDPAVRDRLRSSLCHNTLTLNGRSQSTPDGPFHWRSSTRARSLDWRTAEAFDYFEGTHDGYTPIIHHRAVLSRPGCWYVVDRVVGGGFQRADVHWHLDPLWNARVIDAGCVRADHPDGGTVWIVSPDAAYELVRGTTNGSGLGWCAPAYGQLVPTFTVRATRSGSAPFALVTLVIESRARPRVEMLSVDCHRQDAGENEEPFDAIGLRVSAAEWTERVILTRRASPPPPSLVGDRLWRAGGLVTDARVLCWRDQPERGPVVMIDGSIASDRLSGSSFPLDDARIPQKANLSPTPKVSAT